MKSPIELLKETETLLFSLDPKEARELKKKTIEILNKLSKKENLTLVHQISQERKRKKDFLTWLECSCQCEECEPSYEN